MTKNIVESPKGGADEDHRLSGKTAPSSGLTELSYDNRKSSLMLDE